MKFNFENFLLSLGATRSKKQIAQDLGAMKVSEYEYKNFQFSIFTNEFGLKTTLFVMEGWNPLDIKYCSCIPSTQSFARELIEHLTNFKDSFDVDALN